MTGYDVIGDVHGHAGQLEGLLQKMGYTAQRGAVWAHAERTAIFIGDLIDRGPDQLEALTIAWRMVEAGTARIVLGNHEFNAVAWATYDPVRGDVCRPHSDGNSRQHAAFLAAVVEDSDAHRDWVAWFRTIPLWLDLGALRLVHACWSPAHMAELEPLLTPELALTDEAVVAGTAKGTPAYDALEVILKGPEVALGEDLAYIGGGKERRAARWSWWDPTATTLRAGAWIPPGSQTPDGRLFPELPDDAIAEHLLPPRYADATPVIFGHYWWTGTPAVFSAQLACVDYSVAADGPLVAYRWNEGDRELSSDRFVQFPA